MPETLILHVKGTEAETTELPVDVVREAVADGRLTESQLIWSMEENMWKQVRELPQFRGEILTLHVKGTEAETVIQPRKAVRAAISQGSITHSQLIWSPNEHTWRQVRELPELLPTQKLAPIPIRPPSEPTAIVVLDSPTSPVARVAVRSASVAVDQTSAQPRVASAPRTIPQVRVAGAQIPVAAAPRIIPQVRIAGEQPVAETPDGADATAVTHDATFPTEIEIPVQTGVEAPPIVETTPAAPEAVAVAPTEHPAFPETLVIAEVPDIGEIPAVAEVDAVARNVQPMTDGEIPTAPASMPPRTIPQVRIVEAAPVPPATPTENPDTHLVEVKPSVKVAVATPRVRVATAQPSLSAQPAPKAVSVAPRASASTNPKVKAIAAQARAQAQATATGKSNYAVKHKSEMHLMKWLCLGLGALIILIVGTNYFFVEQPLSSGMKTSAYSAVPVYAHLGAYMQPNVMVVHVRTESLTPDQLADFLVTLAHNTPAEPLSQSPYDRVALTTGWMAHYTISGGIWRQLGDMSQSDPTQGKEMLIESISDAAGEKLLDLSPALDDAGQKAAREKVWSNITTYFTAK